MKTRFKAWKEYWYGLVVRSFINGFYDTRRFLRVCNSKQRVGEMTRSAADSHMMRTMHSLEKGLAMPAPTPDFGTQKAVNLKADADSYAVAHGENRIHALALSVLDSFLKYRRASQAPIENLECDELVAAADRVTAGAREVTREEVWTAAKIDFEKFALSRSSVRIFDERPVDREDLVRAVSIALKSPSVCNRSCGRVYLATRADVIARMLEHQGGAKGFGKRARALFVVVADMSAFYKSGERYQGWIDGGLFAMSLNYALHSMGYGVCMLNWSKDGREDARFRKEFGIPDSHLVVMMMAVGHLPETFKVAVSPRPVTEEVIWSLDEAQPDIRG